MNRKSNRRSFLKKSSGVMAAPYLVPTSVFAASPNDKIAVGIIGPGRRGIGLMGGLPKDQAEIVALADVNKKRLEQRAQGKSWKTFQDYKDMLALDEVDAVIVATPDHWHALNSIHACMAGKDVYVEKPMTLTIQEGRAMVNAARKYERIVQCGSQQRSMTQSRIGCQLVRNQRAGKIQTIHTANYPSPWEQPFPSQPVPEGLDWDMWLGQTNPRGYHVDLYTPRAKPGWISIMPYSGGEMTGWGAHGLDMIQWSLGMDESGPVEIWLESSTRELDDEVYMKYENGALLKLDNQGPPGGALFEGTEGSVLVDRGRYEAKPEEIAKAPLSDSETELYVSHNHMQNWLDCIRSRELPIADVEAGHRSSTVCHLGNIARWLCRKLQWDPKNEKFVDDDDANTYISRPRREPYGIPKEVL